jgi:AraC-like DNA-binding protein
MSLHASVSTCPAGPFASSKAQNDQRIQRVLQAIQADSSQDIAALAGLVRLSVSRLSHLFKLETGCRLRSYLMDWRLELAASVLQSTEASVKETSYTVGYGHPSSFARAFHARFGCSPKQYRSQQQMRNVADSAKQI